MEYKLSKNINDHDTSKKEEEYIYEKRNIYEVIHMKQYINNENCRGSEGIKKT